MKALKIIGTGLTGGFSKSPDLQARFWAWVVFTLLLIGAFSFDSWISYSVFSEYLAYIGSAGDIPGLILSVAFAMAATVSVGVIAYAFVSYRKSISTFNELSDSLRFAGYIAAGLYFCFAGISILANIQGAQQAAERHAAAQVIVNDNQITSVASEWTASKEATRQQYDQELAALEKRIEAIEEGVSTEQGVFQGQRGNAIWKGKRTPYGRALMAELRSKYDQKYEAREQALKAVDATYQLRLDTEKEAFHRKKSKFNHKKEKATTAIRLIVFLIYPIGLGISLFNAHFLYDVQEFLQKGAADQNQNPKYSIGFGPLPQTAIGFNQKKEENESMDISKIKAQVRTQIERELRDEIENEMRAKTLKKTGNIESFEKKEPSHSSSTIYLSNDTPYNLGKKYDMSYSEKKQLNKIVKARNKLIKAFGKEPSINAIAKETDVSWATANKYIEMIKSE